MNMTVSKVIFVSVLMGMAGILIFFVYLKIFKAPRKQNNSRKRKWREVKDEPHSQNHSNKSQNERTSTQRLSDNEAEQLKNSVQHLLHRVQQLELRQEDLVVKVQLIDREHIQLKGLDGNNELKKDDTSKKEIQPDQYEEPHPEAPSTWSQPDDYPIWHEEKPCPEDLYNQSIGDQDKRNKFHETYKPVRIGVANTMERRKDPNLEPKFEDDERGDYLGVCINQKNRLYTVYPFFDVPLIDSSYGAGSMGQVFECSGFDGRQSYDIVKVIKPATFEKKTGNEWQKMRMGILKLRKQG